MLRVLFIGDIFGKPGRYASYHFLKEELAQYNVDFIIANGENSAGGKGITPQVAEELFDQGINVITGGNHIWSKKEIIEYINGQERLLRPLNYPKGVPGRGSGVFLAQGQYKIGVIHICGRVFMGNADCPFRTIAEEIDRIKRQTKIIIVDFHAEATSEKVAMGWFLDGKVSACIGTHTHIPTADARILPNGTAYITDIGMTGPYDSVIGVEKEEILYSFQTQMFARHKVAQHDVNLSAVLIDIDPLSGKASNIERIWYQYKD
jgi:metallophosphoesterase (TIGR00282 family)